MFGPHWGNAIGKSVTLPGDFPTEQYKSPQRSIPSPLTHLTMTNTIKTESCIPAITPNPEFGPYRVIAAGYNSQVMFTYYRSVVLDADDSRTGQLLP